MQQITRRVTVENRKPGGSAVVTPFGDEGLTWTTVRIPPARVCGAGVAGRRLGGRGEGGAAGFTEGGGGGGGGGEG